MLVQDAHREPEGMTMAVYLLSERQACSDHAGVDCDDKLATIREPLQHRLLHDLVQGESLASIMETLCRAVQRMIPGVHIAVAQIDPAGCSRTLTGPDLGENYRAALAELPVRPAPEARRAARRGKGGSMSCVRTDPLWPEYRDLVAGLDYTSIRSIPVKDRLGAVKGTVTFYSRAALSPTVFQWHILEMCVELCALVFDRADAHERVHFLAHRDPLTGLFNRRYFQERLGEAIREAELTGKPLALHLIDLDRFKDINDRRGHLAGDRVLIDIARKLECEAGAGDLVGRLGGDEFIFLQADIGSPEEVLRRAEQLVRVIGTAVSTHDPRIGSGASIGCAIYPRDAATPGDLLRNADLALYKAKAAGGGQGYRYDAGMTAELDRRRGLEDDLRAALTSNDGSLHLAFQPQFSLVDGSLSAVEALARWTHPKLGPIAPETFIPIAEGSGLIVDLGAWALRNACAAAISWPGDVGVTVNLSRVQIADGRLPELVHSVLNDTGLDPRRLELEITENVLIDDRDAALHVLRRVVALGVRIVLDDFGSGYSSLTHLQMFPFGKVKIDRAFVCDLETNPGSRAMVGAVLALCAATGLPVVAEGVETQAQLDILREKKCDFAQGHLFAMPRGRGMVFARAPLIPEIPEAGARAEGDVGS